MVGFHCLRDRARVRACSIEGMRHKNAQPTFDELLGQVRDLPEGYRGQILDGVFSVSPPPTAARAHTVAEISAMLVAGSPLGDPVPEAWAFQTNAEIAVGNEGILVADVAGFRLDLSDLAHAATPLRVAPAWVCEVLCDRTRHFALTAKRRAYAELGVAHLWIADPEAQVLDVFVNQRGKWLLLRSISDEAMTEVPPFEGLRFDAGELWLPSIAAPLIPPSGRPRGRGEMRTAR
jgi:Uma2 family endonuclease